MQGWILHVYTSKNRPRRKERTISHAHVRSEDAGDADHAYFHGDSTWSMIMRAPRTLRIDRDLDKEPDCDRDLE